MLCVQETNRKLAAELTTARISLGDQANELALASSRISDLEESRRELETLVQKLEDDLVTVSLASLPTLHIVSCLFPVLEDEQKKEEMNEDKKLRKKPQAMRLLRELSKN